MMPGMERDTARAQVSWCKLEVTVSSPKAVTALESGGKGRPPLAPSQLPPRPPLALAALNLRTWTNPATGAAEVVAASVVHMAAVRQDVPLRKVTPPPLRFVLR